MNDQNPHGLSLENKSIPFGGTVLELADKLPVMVVLVDLDCRFVFVNRAYSDWLQIRRSNIIGRTVEEVIGSDNDGGMSETRMERVRRVAKNGLEENYEIRVMRPSTGDIRTLSIKLVGHENKNGVYAFIDDVTEKQQALKAEAQYRAVVDTAGEGVIVMNHLGVISSFNLTAERLFGYAADEVIGKNIKMLMPQRYAVNHDGYLKRYEETRVPHIIGQSAVRAECLRKDGTEFPAELAVAELSVNGELHYTGIVRDVTERVEFEKKLKAWNDNLEAEVLKRGRALDRIFNLSADVLAVLGFDGKFQSVSPAAEGLTGIPVEKAIREGIPYFEFAVLEDQAALIDTFNRVVTEGVAVNGYEFRVRNVNGNFRWTSWSILPVMEDEVILLIGRDITAERMRDEGLRQSQKMEAIGQLTGGIAHDFNNLLMGITGSLDLISRKLPEQERGKLTRYLDGAQGSAKRASALTHRLLAFSRRQPLAPVTVDVNLLVGGMSDLIERTIGDQFEVVPRLGDVWPTLCDPNQLESAILNLFLNARDAMPQGGTIVVKTKNITVEDCYHHKIPNGEYVRIAVQDFGSGMDADTLSKVFDPFFTTKPIGQGTGLGMSMLYGFVNQSEGHVRIASECDKGTEVTIYLPRTLVVGEQDEEPITRGTSVAEPGRTILIVEDEIVIRSLICEVLEEAGYKCFEAGEGNEALKYIGDPEMRIDLMISDVGLPGLNGKQLAELTRQVRPELKILFITGYAAGVTLRNELLLDGTDMILKPFTMDLLQAKVVEMLEETEVERVALS